VPQLISVLAEDVPDVLLRILSVLPAQGAIVRSLAAGPDAEAGRLRVTLALEVNEVAKRRVLERIRKLIDVIEASDLDNCPVCREMLLVRLETSPPELEERVQQAETLGARIIDLSAHQATLEITGAQTALDTFIEIMRALGRLEVARSGVVALPGSPGAPSPNAIR